MIPNQRIMRKRVDVVFKMMGYLAFMLFFLFSKNTFAQCEATAGTLGEIQLSSYGNDLFIQAELTEPANVPEGFFHWYLLSTGQEKIIQYLSTMPGFEIQGTGVFTIHSFVFDLTTFDFSKIKFGKTSIAALDTLLLQGGGSWCAGLDLEGTSVNIHGSGAACGAVAGSLTVDFEVCLSDTSNRVRAAVLTPALIPEGFVQAFLLASGDTALIHTVSDSADFVLQQAGSYSIHSFVYDSTTFDFEIIQLGKTTIPMLDTLLQGAGDAFCASLDPEGATFKLVSCAPVCQADAGTLTSGEQSCLSDGTKRVNAIHVEEPFVPEGFSKTYLLTAEGEELIRGISGEPFFILEGEGAFSIHTFVFDTAAYSIDSIKLGATLLDRLLALLEQEEGAFCGALDTVGAVIELQECPCLAEVGLLDPSDVCLDENGAALEATLTVAGVVPEDYKQIFILTSGEEQIIEQTTNEPYFEVADTGRYAIHHLVYNPGSLPLNWIQFGLTPLSVLHSFLKQGGGDICAALDLEGADFDVAPCEEEIVLSPVTFPNPVSEELTVVLPKYLDQKDISVQLIDAFGNISLSRQIAPGVEQLRMNVTPLPEGLYNLRILYGDGRISISKVYILR